MKEHAFVGTWRLVSCRWIDDDGRVTYPYGRSPVGYLIYTDTGHMGVNFMSANRRRFSSQHLLAASAEEERSAKKSYQAYSGRYEVRGDKMIHHVEVSLFPNWVGQEQERYYTLEGNILCLSTEPLPFRDTHQTAYLEWERVSSGGESEQAGTPLPEGNGPVMHGGSNG
jgi:hypothetical protein